MNKFPSERTVEAKLVKALNMLMKNDIDLINNNANERSISHKLAEYLQQEFPEWNVDCEYNRDGHDPKRIHINPKNIMSDDIKHTSVYPDIIIHHRGTNNNAIVIEIKKGSFEHNDYHTNEDYRYDIDKLKEYVKELNYEFRCFICFPNTERELYRYSIVRKNNNNI